MGHVNQPSNVLDQIAALRREVAEVRKKVGLSSATISRGTLRILDGGGIVVESDTGVVLLRIGALNVTRPDGTPQQGMTVARDDGSLVMSVFDPNPDDNYHQYFAFYDRGERIIFSDDTESGQGIARPWLPIPIGRTEPYATTGNTTWTPLWQTHYIKQQPMIEVRMMHGTHQDTTGRCRILVDGHVIEQWDAQRGALLSGTRGPLVVPGNHMQPVSLAIEAMKTSGPGEVYCHVTGATQRQTP